MRITHVISDTNIGGAGRYLLALLPGAERFGWSVTAVVPEGQLADALRAGCSCRQIITLPRGETSFSWDLWRWLVRHLPDGDLVHTHASLAGRLAAKQRGQAVVLTRHTLGPDLPPGGLPAWKSAAYRLTARYLTDAIIAVSSACRQRLLREGVDDQLLHLVYHGVDATLYDNAPDEVWRERLELQSDLPLLVTVARLTAVKGLETALAAAELLRAEGHQFCWLLVGEGPLRPVLQEQISARQLTGYVRLLGYQQDIPGILAAADIFVLPSLQEALGLSVLEGMAAGLPVLASQVGGIPELIADGGDGLLVPAGAAPQLAAGIAKLLSDPPWRRALGERARQKVLQQFSLDEMWRKTDAVYRKALKMKE